ncbi:MAG: Asp23/Gls24 family envelope stress response protein [Roseiflexaceae bacterium]|nr:Asp23/Gls24 family envelope stress response protein [Roseiflexaceae bacterium]
MTPSSGSVSVAPSVLVRLVRLAVSEVPGVARTGLAPATSMLGATTDRGIAAKILDEQVSADCYVIAKADTNLLELGVTIQATVAAVIQQVLGMAVREVNVYIQDVEVSRG